MSQTDNPAQLNLQTCAAASAVIAGHLAQSTDATRLETTFSRLAAESSVPNGLAHVSWRAETSLRDVGEAQPQIWLHLDASAALPMICQRCMSPTTLDVTTQRWFRFVADEATAEMEDDECEEDVLVLPPRLDLLALVEDELLMSLPLVPMHDECPVPVVTQVADRDFVDVPVERTHPFADLKLKMKASDT